MQIVTSPPAYSPAYKDVIFKITADENEIAELDIYNHDNSQIIGKKRFTGSNAYDMNVANYAKRQFEIAPLPAANKFTVPEGRIVNLKLKEAGGMASAETKLNAGLFTYPNLKKLSSAPAKKTIRHNESDEIPFISSAGDISVHITLTGAKRSEALVAVSTAGLVGLVVFGLSMIDLQEMIVRKKLGNISDYNYMELHIVLGSSPIIIQEYDIMPPQKNNVRICWWNSYGQIDYYTLKSMDRKTITAAKSKIYSSDGYRTVASEAEKLYSLTSEYENEETMEWLSEVISSPKVWMMQNGKYTPVDIVTNSMTTKSHELTKLDLTVRMSRKTEYQNL